MKEKGREGIVRRKESGAESRRSNWKEIKRKERKKRNEHKKERKEKKTTETAQRIETQ